MILCKIVCSSNSSFYAQRGGLRLFVFASMMLIIAMIMKMVMEMVIMVTLVVLAVVVVMMMVRVMWL